MAKIKYCGVNKKTYGIKLTHIADDNTIIINGSKDSLQAAHNILEIYSKMLWTEIDTEETQSICVKRWHHSRKDRHKCKLQLGKF